MNVIQAEVRENKGGCTVNYPQAYLSWIFMSLNCFLSFDYHILGFLEVFKALTKTVPDQRRFVEHRNVKGELREIPLIIADNNAINTSWNVLGYGHCPLASLNDIR